MNGKTLLIVTNWGFPFGGGEEFMYHTAYWSKELELHTVWISFSSAQTQKNNQTSSAKYDKDTNLTMLHVTGGLTIENVEKYIKLFRPILVHHQGFGRKIVAQSCQTTRVPFVTGIHFWNEIIDLDQVYQNAKIMDHLDRHQTHPDFTSMLTFPECYFYSVSPYVTEVVKMITQHNVEFQIEPASSKQVCHISDANWSAANNKYVTVLNYHEKKGGTLIYEILKNISFETPFLLVRTEEGCDEFYDKINKLVLERAAHGAKDRLIGRTAAIKIYEQTHILLIPSLVDETYCRVANEGLMNAIPIVTTGYGNLKYLVKDGGHIIDPENVGEWVDVIEKLSDDPEYYAHWQTQAKLRYASVSEDLSKNAFQSMVKTIFLKSKAHRVMILSPWCDQGLGIQSRNYKNILELNGYEVSIFAIKPYDFTSAQLQKDPNEWLHPRIVYSENDREHIKDEELLEFLDKWRPGKCLIPETCWFRIFQIARFLREHGVETYAIPNIEIVREDEIYKHEAFTKILANNYLCANIFTKFGLTNQYVGYNIEGVQFKPKVWPHTDEGPLKFICIGGRNAFTRKQVTEICESFVQAYEHLNNTHKIMLTVTIQKYLDDSIDKYRHYDFIKIIDYELKYSQILDLYYDNHINIQVSKHEGLGIGFYESVATGTPVITLDTSPHNEIILDGVNGWLVPCTHKKMTDNNNALFGSAYFKTEDLKQKIIEITETQSLNKIVETLKADLDDRLNHQKFVNRFISSLS